MLYRGGMIAGLLTCLFSMPGEAAPPALKSRGVARPQVARPTPPPPRLTIGPSVVVGSQVSTFFAPEIWQKDPMMCWQDGNDNTIWVCQLDPASGDLIPPSGRGIRVGKAAPFEGDWLWLLLFGKGERGTLNGPEWGNSQQGVGVYYTMKDENGVYQQAKSIFPFTQPVQITFGGTIDRSGNLASKDPNDAQARIAYYQMNQTSADNTFPQPAFWQLDDSSQPQHVVPMEKYSYNGPRWIPNSHSIATFLKAPDNTYQVAAYDIDTHATEFLTKGPEQHIDGVVLNDPQTDTPRYLVCIEDQQKAATYEKIGGVWTKVATVVPPDLVPGGESTYRLTGTRPFLLQGELFFTYYVIDGFSPINTYIANLNGTVNEVLIKNTFPLFQINPKVLLGDQPNKFHVYYYTSLPIHVISRLGTFRRVTVTVAPNP